jgi:phenylacetate-CoA ligase
MPEYLRYGRAHYMAKELIRESEKWSRKEILQYHYSYLVDLLKYCGMYVPYYANIFKKYNIKYDNLQSLSDYQNIPFLDKALIRENLAILKSRQYSEKQIILATTGGSSGTPSQLYRYSGPRKDVERAYIGHLWGRVGVSFKTRRMVLRGPRVSDRKNWVWNSAERELICSTYHLNDNQMAEYFKQLKAFRIEAIHGHVSSIATFAQFLVKNELNYPLKAVLGASENVYEFQRKVVYKAFSCRLYSWYGQTEQVALAGEATDSIEYEILPTYGYTELIDEGGNVINEPEISGEIVATGFINPIMPLIRYRTGDFASYARNSGKFRNNNFDRFENIEGRSYEYVYKHDGSKISLTGLIFGQHFEGFERIRRMQLVQYKKGHLEIHIVKESDYRSSDEKEIETIIEHATKGGLSVSFKYPKHIALTERGKHKFLIQNINDIG